VANNPRKDAVESEAEKARKEARNEDPITGQPGAHPASVGVGTAAGGAIAGAAAGAVGGPIGAAVGAVVGGVGGGLAGKAVGEQMDPTRELDYWRGKHHTQDYVTADEPFEMYEPAYRYGIESASRADQRTYPEMETDLRKGWKNRDLDWDRASPAIRAAYERSCAIRRTTV
jgi:uncharacterized protein YcfJ